MATKPAAPWASSVPWAELDSGALQLLRGQLTLVPVANPLARS